MCVGLYVIQGCRTHLGQSNSPGNTRPSLHVFDWCKMLMVISVTGHRFDQPFYEVVITDLLRRGQFVSRVTASDADSPDSTDLGYAIIGGNKRRSFTIEGDTGVLRLSRLRTPDLLPSYVLNVSVTDGVFTSFARIKIIVRNSNGHVPEFIQGVYDVDVSENLPAGQQVATLRAKDGDQGRFGRLTYAIESDDAEEIFSIDKDTGMPLDR